MMDPVAGIIHKLVSGHGANTPVRHWMAGLFFRYYPGNITCKQFEAFIVDYHEGSLPASNRELFDRHMSRCQNCRSALLGYVKTIKLGKLVFEDEPTVLPDDVPPELVNAILLTMKSD